MKTRRPKTVKRPEAAAPHWDLRLYVAGRTPRSAAAFRNLNRICEEHLAGRYHIDVVDLVKDPQIARSDQILAVPTVVRRKPLPAKRIIGDMSDTERVLAGLDLRPYDPFPLF
jgi:circadian clock protein KaiB